MPMLGHLSHDLMLVWYHIKNYIYCPLKVKEVRWRRNLTFILYYFIQVPLDIVVNAMVAAMAKHGKSMESGLFTYHITSSTINPLTLFDLFKSFYNYFTLAPLMDANGGQIRVEEVKFVDSIDEFRFFVEKAVLRKCTNNENGSSDQKRNKRVIENITHLGRLYEPYFFYKAR